MPAAAGGDCLKRKIKKIGFFVKTSSALFGLQTFQNAFVARKINLFSTNAAAMRRS